MPPLSASETPEGEALSPNAIVFLICVGIAFFLMCLACVCDAFIRSDAAMMAVARPKTCLTPNGAPIGAAPPHGATRR